MSELDRLVSEGRNPRTMDIDLLPTIDVLRKINDEDRAVPTAVEKVLPDIAAAVDRIVLAFQKGARLVYMGAGTSGRLGVLDASECPPTFGVPVPSHLSELNWLETVGDFEGGQRVPTLQINDILSIKRAVQGGAGIAMLPDYVISKDSNLVQLLPETEVPSFDTYFAYPDAMKNQAKLHVFRDFIIAKARSWSY